MKAYKYDEVEFMKEETRVALLEQSIGHISETLIRLEKRFDTTDQRIDGLSQEMKQNFKEINNRLWTNFFWMISGFAGILGLVAHALHWF